MGWPWALPFIGILLSIATGPLLYPRIWHHHYGKIAAGWALLTVLPLAIVYGVPAAFAAFTHALLGEYLSFIILLFALYTVAGGILVTGNLRGNPATNTAVLAFGTAIASLVGTTGATMILVRPLIRANIARPVNAHVFVFFIILVANVGGALSPLGDPPLFVGFLRGIDFFWTTQHLLPQTLIMAISLLALFFAIDSWRYRAEHINRQKEESPRFAVRGAVNLLLIVAIILAILLCARWQPGIAWNVFGTPLALQNIARDVILLTIAFLSVRLTPREHRLSNGFSWEPIREVAKLFAAIFIAIIPVLAMLQAGHRGSFAWLLALVSDAQGNPSEIAYFWLTGLLSAFLDNAPTYLVFFELAGGNPATLMGPMASVLAAISMGAVYMGALTYLGNAPNLMVYAIANDRGIRMPSFFAYSFWAACILLPLFLLLTVLSHTGILKFL
ncbi:MAG: sodium:proton antiporter [Pseudorhodoplanes sp.]